MCLFTTKKKAIRLKEDMVVYKAYIRDKENELRSPCCNTLVRPNKNNIVKAEFLHKSSKRKFRRTKEGGEITTDGNYIITDGFIHCIRDLKDLHSQFNDFEYELYMCVIPKRTYIYYGDYGDIAARKIKIVSRL